MLYNSCERGVRKCERTALETSRPKKKEQGKVLQTWSRESLTVHGKDHGDPGCAHATHGGPWQSRYPHYTEDCKLEQAPSRNCDLWRGTHRGRSFFAAAVASCGSSIHLKDCTSLKGTQTEAFHRLSPMEGSHAGAGEEHEEEGVE